MEYASIERELYIEASPEIVYKVVSTPDQITQWWSDEADFTSTPGENGTITFYGHGVDGGPAVEALTVVTDDPPRLFSFRWTHDAAEEALNENSLHVTFELVPRGSGTLLKLSETGFRERGWDDAKVAATYADHANGWDQLMPRLGAHATSLVTMS
jgi:uncharacterized protein YndB with AHSA1/START domain